MGKPLRRFGQRLLYEAEGRLQQNLLRPQQVLDQLGPQLQVPLSLKSPELLEFDLVSKVSCGSHQPQHRSARGLCWFLARSAPLVKAQPEPLAAAGLQIGKLLRRQHQHLNQEPQQHQQQGQGLGLGLHQKQKAKMKKTKEKPQRQLVWSPQIFPGFVLWRHQTKFRCVEKLRVQLRKELRRTLLEGCPPSAPQGRRSCQAKTCRKSVRCHPRPSISCEPPPASRVRTVEWSH
mmetsp:Transcript_40117/g.86003  ORF Transcript_40117/g.86003 Transcript_40117/m.86003 type:complete len:233 (-) Transcript_40117:297-995(-)